MSGAQTTDSGQLTYNRVVLAGTSMKNDSPVSGRHFHGHGQNQSS
jgi:hypothetical protein